MADRTELQALVEEFISAQQEKSATEICTGVKDGRFSVLKLVEELGSNLTSSQAQTRGRGVQLLSQVLQKNYSDLSESEVMVLVEFYENRLKDHYAITPHVLHGLKALARCRALPQGSAVSILKALFQDVNVQSLMLSERSCVYNILISLMESREEELKALGSDLVFGFVQAVDGERDPRNLLLAFKIARNIIHRGYELNQFTEELFEVMSCYFPIDFTPPANDPRGITQEELILALRAVLTGTPRFAEFLLPLLIEKLDSDVQNSKVDSLQTLAACGPVYGHKELTEFLPGLWSSIRREVFQTASEKVESAGLSALSALTSCLSRSVLASDSDDVLQTFLQLVLPDCQQHLYELDLKLLWPSAKLLQAACGASYRASLIVTAAVLPPLLDQYTSKTQCAQRRTLLEVLFGFIQPTGSSQPAEGEDSVLVQFRDSLCSVVFSALTESNSALQITATKVLTALGHQHGVLAESDVDLAVDHLTRLVLEDDDAQVSSAVMECAGSLARVHPPPFTSRMIPKLKEEIFTASMDNEDSTTLQTGSRGGVRRRCMTALASISSQISLVEQSAPILLQVLTSAHTGGCTFSMEEVTSTCCSLYKIAGHARHTQEIGLYFHNVVVPRLLGLALQAALQSNDQTQSNQISSITDDLILTELVPIISTTCSALQPPHAAQMAARVVSLFLNSDTSFLPDNTYSSKINLLKCQSGGCTQSKLVCLLMASVCSLPRHVEVPEVDRLLAELEELVFTCTHPFSFTSAAKCFSGLINKRAAGAELDDRVNKSFTRISSELDCRSSACRLQAFTLLVWMAKALLLRYHPLSTKLTNKLFSLLDDEDGEFASQAADSFSLLMSDSADVLNRENHADVRLMYRQRFFTENSNKLVQGFNSAQPERRSTYLKALSHMINNLPRQVQLTELPELMPVLLEALSCPDEAVQLSTLSCLQPLLLEPPPALTNQLEALFARLLALTGSSTMKVRMCSLRCIHALSHLPSHLVLPFRTRVLRALATPLDDKKRLVRKEAVAARGEWFLLGSPGGK
ncbi:MMS19 nucleotide excision repair protein homolog [Trichomycterus rosablanca]|uniref:MMS19 nucleotide excision repair protein homolog n=1 Tax=Trichomycterus rosablanca TaxID=2290929 RepID=UPI002F3544F2